MKPLIKTAAAPLPDGRLQLWGIDTANQLWTRWQTSAGPNADWSGWSQHGGIAKVKQIAVAPMSNKALHLWAVDTNNVLWTCWKTSADPDADWSAWGQHGGISNVTQVAAAPLSNGALQLWAVDTGNVLWTCRKNGTKWDVGWTAWSKHSSPIEKVKQIAVAPLSNGALQLWAVDAGNSLMTCWQTGPKWNAGWSAWSKHGSPFDNIAQIAVAPLSDKSLQLWAVDTGGVLWTCWKVGADANAGWSAWSKQSGNAHVKQIAAAPLANKALQLWVLDDKNALWTCWKENANANAAWSAWAMHDDTIRPEGVWTNFDPKKHGFKFNNQFKGDIAPGTGLNMTVSGFCGGMVFAALDYYHKGMRIPQQDYQPANSENLGRYIWNRLLDSIMPNLGKWSELTVNLGGMDNRADFEAGLSGELSLLRKQIDAGKPVVLGVFKPDAGLAGPHHQVLAIGYDMGQYKGDLGAHQSDLKIYIYDPNEHDTIQVLTPDLGKLWFRESNGSIWRTYFVDKSYAVQTPPVIPGFEYPNDGKVHELIVTFGTGGDDLRGGDDNLHATVNFYNDLNMQEFSNLNGSMRWVDNYDQSVRLALSRPVPANEIKSLDLFTTFGGGLSGDNWNMNSLHIRFKGGSDVDNWPYKKSGSPLKRFTGKEKRFTAHINNPPPNFDAGKVSQLNLTITTGADDLRGGNDNLDVIVHFRNGSKLRFNNVNQGKRWAENSAHTVSIFLNNPVPVGDLDKVELFATVSGGIGGDNFDMLNLVIQALGGGIDQILYVRPGFPLHRFTGDRKRFIADF